MSKQHPKPRVKIFFEGRYRKLVRGLPQTVFFCPECKGRGKGCERCEGFGKLTKDSVQELMARVAMPRFKSRKNKFHGAGREDIDVRMLGSGRPFVFELINPKNLDADLAAVEEEINKRYEGQIEVTRLTFCSRKRVPEIKERKSHKEYGAKVQLGGGLDPEKVKNILGKRMEIVQRTPTRVSHRRADMERNRWIQIEEITPLENDQCYVRLLSAHGTYIKEAISGTRTEPSLPAWLGVPCECIELDVLEIFDIEENEISNSV